MDGSARPAGLTFAARLGLIIAAATAVLDQASKLWLVNLSPVASGGRVALLPFLDLVYQRNPGISYSLFEMRGPGGQLLLAGFAFAVSAGLTLWLLRMTEPLRAAAVGLIVGGAIGNAFDRLTLGGVADFISLHAFGFYWYIFNIADVAIVAGVLGLMYESLVNGRKGAPNRT
jgi:signal peptidase II